MQIAVDELARRYREMTDEQLLALRPKDLTDEARMCHSIESAARGLPVEAVPEELALESLPALTKGDSRKPVLYLRSFSADTESISDFIGTQRPQSTRTEALFLLPFRTIGPVVAINPADKDDKRWSGSFANPAVRLQPSGDWQKLFFDLLAQAQLVVIHAGSTTSLLWEIEHVFRHEPFVPAFLLMLGAKADFVPEFGGIVKSATGMSLRKALFRSPVIFFPSRNQALPIAGATEEDQFLCEQLHPLVSPLSRVLEKMQPGVRSDIFRTARGVRHLKLSMAVGLCATSLAFYFMLHGCQ